MDIYFSILEEEDEEDEKRTEQIRKRLQLQLQLRSRIEDKNHQRKKKKKRRKKVTLQYMDDDGNLCTMTPTKTIWYIYYIRNGNEIDARAKEKFRQRFRLPHEQFCQLLKLLEEDVRFQRWRKGACDGTGMAASPLSLLLLVSLRYLGRDWTFDDIEENTAISEEVHRVFFHKFIDYCSTTLFYTYVIAPTNAEEARTHMMDYVIAGIPGCVSSTDATHIEMGCCPNQICHIYKEYKLNFPSCTYNLSCNHRQCIL